MHVDNPNAEAAGPDALGFRRPGLVRGSGVVGIGPCTLDWYWDPVARAIMLRQLDRKLWAGTSVAGGGQLACCSNAAKRGLALCACLVLFVLRVCVLELSVFPLAPLSGCMCWNALRLPAFHCVNHTLLILPQSQTSLMYNSPLFLLLCDTLPNCHIFPV